MTKKQFSVGDAVVYPAHGAGHVVAIERLAISGAPESDYYNIHCLTATTSVLVLVGKPNGLRMVSSPKQARRALRVLKTPPFRLRRGGADAVEASQTRQQKLRKGGILQVAEVLRDTWHMTEARATRGEEQRQKALNLLASELSLALEITLDASLARIRTCFEEL